jgi:hypothetical protein
MTMPRIVMILLILGLAACGSKDKDVQLRKIKHEGNGPDEFSIIPSKPLEAPEDFAILPAPTPGGSNRTDQNPRGDGIAALGGNPGALVAAGISSADGALINHTSRFGANPGIRQTLRQEDQETRRRHGKVNILNIGPNDDYTNAYRKQWLDSYAEYERLRRKGVTVPSAPPPE